MCSAEMAVLKLSPV